MAKRQPSDYVVIIHWADSEGDSVSVYHGDTSFDAATDVVRRWYNTDDISLSEGILGKRFIYRSNPHFPERVLAATVERRRVLTA